MESVDSFVWIGGNGEQFSSKDLLSIVKKYASRGGKVYVGSDSMMHAGQSCFVCVIALHSRDTKIARYFYKKLRLPNDDLKNLQTRIFKEVQYSVAVADYLRRKLPDAYIEVHVDIGTTTKSLTRKFVNVIRGWVVGSGFKFKFKPDSWAASSVADWHTK